MNTSPHICWRGKAHDWNSQWFNSQCFLPSIKGTTKLQTSSKSIQPGGKNADKTCDLAFLLKPSKVRESRLSRINWCYNFTFSRNLEGKQEEMHADVRKSEKDGKVAKKGKKGKNSRKHKREKTQKRIVSYSVFYSEVSLFFQSISQLPDFPVSQYPNFPIYRFPNFPISQFPNFPISRFPNFPISQFPNFPIYVTTKRAKSENRPGAWTSA